jgi:hypothetical protein
MYEDDDYFGCMKARRGGGGGGRAHKEGQTAKVLYITTNSKKYLFPTKTADSAQTADQITNYM